MSAPPDKGRATAEANSALQRRPRRTLRPPDRGPAPSAALRAVMWRRAASWGACEPARAASPGTRRGAAARGRAPRRYSRSRSCSVKAMPLLYLGLRSSSTPLMTVRTQGIALRCASSSPLGPRGSRPPLFRPRGGATPPPAPLCGAPALALAVSARAPRRRALATLRHMAAARPPREGSARRGRNALPRCHFQTRGPPHRVRTARG